MTRIKLRICPLDYSLTTFFFSLYLPCWGNAALGDLISDTLYNEANSSCHNHTSALLSFIFELACSIFGTFIRVTNILGGQGWLLLEIHSLFSSLLVNTNGLIQGMLAIQPLAPAPSLDLACTLASSQFMYCWSLTWRILSITLLACEMSTTVQ